MLASFGFSLFFMLFVDVEHSFIFAGHLYILCEESVLLKPLGVCVHVSVEFYPMCIANTIIRVYNITK